MALPFKKDSNTKRREELRNILGPGRSAGKSRFRAYHVLKQYIAEHYKLILSVSVIVACVFTNIYFYNRLTVMRQQIGNLDAQIESGLQMRLNIVPSLTVAVNRFINYEKALFTSALETRADSLGSSKAMDKLVDSSKLKAISGKNILPNDLARFVAVAENYPQLVSSQSYQFLIQQIADVENQIYSKRSEFNNAVNTYNTYLNTFPANMIGRVMGFHPEEYFTWDSKPEWVFTKDSASGELSLKMNSEKNESKD